jgi:hypothetical protein
LGRDGNFATPRYHQFGAVDLDYLRKIAPEMLKFLAKRKAR